MTIISLNLKRFLQRVRIARNADRCNSQTNSVCLSVRPSRSGACFVQTNKDTTAERRGEGGKEGEENGKDSKGWD